MNSSGDLVVSGVADVDASECPGAEVIHTLGPESLEFVRRSFSNRPLLFLLSNSRPRIALLAAMAILQSAMVLPIPLFTQYSFAELDAGRIGSSVLWFLVGGLLYVLSFFVQYLVRSMTLHGVKKQVAHLRAALLEVFLRAPRFSILPLGSDSIRKIIAQDVERLDIYANALLANLIPGIAIACSTFLLLLSMNWRLALLIVGPGVILVLCSRSIRKKLKNLTERFHESFAALEEGITQSVAAWDTIRAHGAEARHLNQLMSKQIEALRSSSMQISIQRSTLGWLQGAIVASMALLLMVTASVLTKSDPQSGPLLVGFIAALGLFRKGCALLFQGVPQYVDGAVAVRGIRQWLASLPVASRRRPTIAGWDGSVVVESVQYKIGERTVVDGISFSLTPGSVVGLYGKNGAGKSTLIQLVLGEYRPHAGTVSASGRFMHEWDRRTLSSSCAVLHQSPALISGTLLENLNFTAEQSRAEAEVAAELKRLGLFRWFELLPGGLECIIRPGAQEFSGGERQRIALARTLLRPAKLLILDEPTNHLDQQSCDELLNVLKILAEERSCCILIASHDSRILAVCSTVVSLESARGDASGV